MSKNNAIYVQTLSKGLQILEFLVEKQNITVTTLAKHMNLQKSASYRFLNTLRLHGYVDQDASNNYFLTNRLEKLGNGIVPKLEFYSLARQLLNGLTKNYIKHDTIANLGFWNGNEVVYLVQSTHNAYMQFHENSTVPGYCSALGKAILAYAPTEEVEAYIAKTDFEKFTEHTVGSGEQLRKELESVRTLGYATVNDELCLGLKAIGIPLIQEDSMVRYAVSLSQTRYDSIEPIVEIFNPLLQKVSKEILQYLNLDIYSSIK